MPDSKNITRTDLINDVAAKTGLTKLETKAVFDSMLESIIDFVSKGDRIELRGFGVFNPKIRQPRIARNPRTGEDVQIEKRVIPVFKPSTEFLRIVDENHK